MSNLRIGVPSKGRLAESVSELMDEAGLKFRRSDRRLFARVRDMPIDVVFLRAHDIPVLCAEGALDLGVTTGDKLEESGQDVGDRIIHRLDLGFGHCRMAFCVPEDSPFQKPADLDGSRIATSNPAIVQRYFDEHNISGHIVKLSGSVEIMISLGVADAIVDIIETGSTLAANRLRILAEIGHYQTVMVQSATAGSPEVCDRVVRRLQGIVIARSYSMLEYNIPETSLAAAEKLTPGFESPTISRLEEAGWLSVRSMVKRNEVIETMERLENLGATAILETAISNCRP
jgi:ATP phosphoribosyltransferase